jgi:hypothetical protein
LPVVASRASTTPSFEPTTTVLPETTGVPVKSPCVDENDQYGCSVAACVGVGPSPPALRVLARS